MSGFPTRHFLVTIQHTQTKWNVVIRTALEKPGLETHIGFYFSSVCLRRLIVAFSLVSTSAYNENFYLLHVVDMFSLPFLISQNSRPPP